jgi:hypothetical protein
MKTVLVWIAAALTLAALVVGVVFLIAGPRSLPQAVIPEGLFGSGEPAADTDIGIGIGNSISKPATAAQGASGPGGSAGGTVLTGPPQIVNRTDQTQWWGTPALDAPLIAQGARLHPEDPERTHREMNKAFEKQQENMRKLVTQEQN